MLKPLLRGSLAATLLALGSLAQADSFKHFRHMVFRESPVEDLRGRYEISPEGARTTLHHRFRYDDQGRLTEVRRAVGDTVDPQPRQLRGLLLVGAAGAHRVRTGQGDPQLSTTRPGDRIAAHGHSLAHGVHAGCAGPSQRTALLRQGRQAGRWLLGRTPLRLGAPGAGRGHREPASSSTARRRRCARTSCSNACAWSSATTSCSTPC
jgi:hypothetical protein